MRSDLALYLGARAFGQVGHNLFIATLFFIAGTGDHAAVGLGSVMAATTISAMVFGIPGGAMADRLGPGRGFALGSSLRSGLIGLRSTEEACEYHERYGLDRFHRRFPD